MADYFSHFPNRLCKCGNSISSYFPTTHIKDIYKSKLLEVVRPRPVAICKVQTGENRTYRFRHPEEGPEAILFGMMEQDSRTVQGYPGFSRTYQLIDVPGHPAMPLRVVLDWQGGNN